MQNSHNTYRAVEDVAGQRPTTRLLVLSLGLGAFLLLVAVMGLAWISRSRSSPSVAQPVAVTAETSPTAPIVIPQPQPPGPAAQPAPSHGPDLAPDVVVQVNHTTIRQDELRRMQAADRAIAGLLGQSPPTGDDVLERLVNEELVWQAAEAAGFALGEDQVTQSLQDFLAARGKSTAALEQALAANGLSLGDFKAYFGRLLLIDRFSRAQAQAQGVTVAEYVGKLQRSARISFGPAAETAMTTPGHLQPTATVLPARSGVTATGVVSEAPMATATAAVPRGAAEGQYAPLFELPTINYPAADFLTLNDLAGKPALLSFWTTWCPYCQRQTPVLVDAYNRYAERGVQFVGIDVRENQEQAQEYIRANGIPYPIALDSGGEVAGRYEVTGFPITYFLDAEGRIVARHLGQLSAEQVDRYLQQLLALQNP